MNPYKKRHFSISNTFLRIIWNFTWLILCRWTPNNLHSWRCLVLRCWGAKIGKTNFIYPDCKIWAPWLLETEDVVTIGASSEIYNPGGVFLGSHSIISQGAYLCGATHDYNVLNFTYISKKIEIGPYAWVCARAIVLPGVVMGEGSILGAGSITAKSLDSWRVYSGNPACFVKERTKFI